MRNRHIIFAIVFSLLLHLLIIFLLANAPSFNKDRDEAGPIEVYLDEPKNGWQIADIPEPAVQEKPDNSKFLGMYNQKVQQETVSKTRPDPSQIGDKISEKGKRSESKEPAGKPKSPEKKSDLAMLTPAKKYKPSPKNEITNGSPSGTFAQMPEDFYPDYRLGNHTYLNVLRYPEVEYFVRLKRIFKMTWNPIPALRQDTQTTSVHSGAVSVVLAVSVNKEGKLDELFVLKSSGLSNYDNEALRTIRASSPFSSPPEKFVKADGLLRMSWTFIVYM